MPRPWENYGRPDPRPAGPQQPWSRPPRREPGEEPLPFWAQQGAPAPNRKPDTLVDPFGPEPTGPPAPPTPPEATALAPAWPAAVATTPATPASPAAVFVGSYLFLGIAAVLLTVAAAAVFARQSFPGPIVIGVSSSAVILAGLVAGLAAADFRGRRLARVASWAVGALTIGAGAAVLIVEPGASPAWFAQLTQAGAGGAVAVAVLSTVLLALPASNAYFRSGRPQPAAPAPVVPPPPARAPEFDPFA